MDILGNTSGNGLKSFRKETLFTLVFLVTRETHYATDEWEKKVRRERDK